MSKKKTQQKYVPRVFIAMLMTMMLLNCTYATPTIQDAKQTLMTKMNIQQRMEELGAFDALNIKLPDTSANTLKLSSQYNTYFDHFFKKIFNLKVTFIMTLLVYHVHFRTNWAMMIPIFGGIYIIPSLLYSLIIRRTPSAPPKPTMSKATEDYLNAWTNLLDNHQQFKDELETFYHKNVEKKINNPFPHDPDVEMVETKILNFFKSMPALDVSEEFKRRCEKELPFDSSLIRGGNARIIFEKDFAIKRILQEDRDKREHYYYAKREVMLAIIAHVYYPDLFVRTYGMFCENSYCYIIMDKYGQSLEIYLNLYKQNTWSNQNLIVESKLLQFFNDVMKAFRHLYFNHHDIKPENILCQRHGTEILFSIIDFGFGSFHGMDEHGKYDTLQYFRNQPTTSFYAHVLGWTSFMGWDLVHGSLYHQNLQIVQRYHNKKDAYAFGMIFIKYYLVYAVTRTLYPNLWEIRVNPADKKLKEKYLEDIKRLMKNIKVSESSNDIHGFINNHVIKEWKFWGETQCMESHNLPDYMNDLQLS